MQNYFKFLTLLAFVFLYGCKDSATNSGVAGNMVGYVVAIDSTGTNRDNTGVKISIDGTNYSAISDSSGRWEMNNVLPGTYNISFTKDKFATEKMIAYRFVGNGTDYLFSQNIYEIMWTRASLVLRPFDSVNAIFSCRLFRADSTKSLYGGALLLFGKKPSLDPLDPNSFSFALNNINTLYDTTLGFNINIYYPYFITTGFHSDDTIYCQAFVSNLFIERYDPNSGQQYLGPSYFDIASNKRIYTGFGNNHSEVRSFILP